MAVLGTLTVKAQELDANMAAMAEEFDLNARRVWKEKGEGILYERLQLVGKCKIDKSFQDARIEVLTSFDVKDDSGKVVGQELRWCGAVVKRISDGTWLYPNARTRCYKENEAADILWDPILEVEPTIPACRGIVELPERKWNKDCEGAWRKDIGTEDFGL